MNIIDAIVNFYNDRINRSKDALITSSVFVLGNSLKNLITERVDTLMPVYVVTREGLDKTLESLCLHSLDEKTINFFQDFLKDDDRRFLGNYGYLKSSTLDLLNKGSVNYALSFYDPVNSLGFHYFQDIYPGTLSKDLIYINHFLIYLGIKKVDNNFVLGTSNVFDDVLLQAFSNIINQLSVLVLINLHGNGIYVFDNKSLIPSIGDYLNALPPTFFAFYKTFKDIIYLLVMDFERFLNVVGEDEFLEFAFLLNSNEVDGVDEVINRMIGNKNYYMSNSAICQVTSLSLIESSFKKYKRGLDN